MQKPKKIKIAIVGGSSYIGSNLIKNISKNKNVNIVSTYCNFKNNPNKKIHYLKLDINKIKKNTFEYLGYPDVVLNLSWPDLNNYKSKSHFKTFLMQRRLIKNLIDNGCKNLIMTGTCLEYGKRNGQLKENMKSNPSLPYAKAKLQLLMFLKSYKKKKKFNLIWLRLFYIYGINSKKNTLYNQVKNFEKGKIKKLDISGYLIRDYLSIKDVCEKIKKIIFLKKDIGVLNICSGKPILIKKIVAKFILNKKKMRLINFKKKNSYLYEGNNFWGNDNKFNKL